MRVTLLLFTLLVLTGCIRDFSGPGDSNGDTEYTCLDGVWEAESKTSSRRAVLWLHSAPDTEDTEDCDSEEYSGYLEVFEGTSLVSEQMIRFVDISRGEITVYFTRAGNLVRVSLLDSHVLDGVMEIEGTAYTVKFKRRLPS